MLKDELRTETGFFELLERLTKLPRNDIQATFTDLENETVAIADQFDLDYFLTDAGKSNFLTVSVVSRVPDSTKYSVNLADSNFSGFLPPAKPTAEMNIQTDRVPTTEQCSETQSCQLSNNAQQVHIAVEQDSKDTQTKVPETVDQQVETHGTVSSEMRLLERIQALERSIFSQQSVTSQVKQETEPSPKVAKPVITTTNVGITCDGCAKKNFVGKRFKCQVCADYDLCETCEAKNTHQHPMVRLEIESSSNLAKSVVTTTHLGINCDGCAKKNFTGKRFKCLVCPDYDLCEVCEADNTHQHPMIRCSSQTDTLLLEKMRRKYNKFSTRGFRFPPRDGHGGLGHCLRAAREMFSKNREERGHSHPWLFRGAPQQPQPMLDEKEKRDMLRFMLPNAEEHWETIITKWGHLPILEFCAVLTTWEAPTN